VPRPEPINAEYRDGAYRLHTGQAWVGTVIRIGDRWLAYEGPPNKGRWRCGEHYQTPEGVAHDLWGQAAKVAVLAVKPKVL
jgi:hypothetical protein